MPRPGNVCYDANGNRLTQTGTTASTYTVASTSNKLSSTSGGLVRTFSYNLSGSVLTSGATTHTYYNSGRMATGKLGAAGVTTYIYNALGQRVKKSGGAITTPVYFVYDEAGHLIGEYTISGSTVTTLQETVWLGDIPIATVRPISGVTTVFYVHTDQLNTPRKITSAANVLQWKWDPTPFGEGTPSEPAGTFKYNLRFPGQYFDLETNLNYNYFRDYDPAKGGYVESDPIGLDGGLNTYGYVSANPLSNVDILGLIKKCIMRLMLVTAYDDKGPGKDWPYYKTHPDGVGPGTIATANTSPTPYPFGSTFDVLNGDGSVGYSGINHDTGAGWDRNHHNVDPKHWIDIWLPPSDGKNKHKNAMKWGKQWRAVKICTEECSNEPDDPDAVLPYFDLFQH